MKKKLKNYSPITNKLTFSQLVWIFVVGSSLGYIIEIMLVFLRKELFINRQGLIYGPFIPIYGIGGVLLTLFLYKFKDSKPYFIFLVSAIGGALVEYICSWVQQMVWGTVSWNYSNIAFNLGGRTSLYNAIQLGIVGVIFIKIIYPWFCIELDHFSNKAYKFLTIVFVAFMIFDISISIAATYRQTERRNNIKATNDIQKFLDYHYPDILLNSIYNNSKVIR